MRHDCDVDIEGAEVRAERPSALEHVSLKLAPEAFHKEAVWSHGLIFMSGAWGIFHPSCGFTFRINLARLDEETLTKVSAFIRELCTLSAPILREIN